ncbi:MAG: hypothetical protein J6A56_00850, partial [Clostridia bacterium]|nr:hypothetical protein [Clostridia bacterium]
MEKLGADAVFVINYAEGFRPAQGDLNRLAKHISLCLYGKMPFNSVKVMPEKSLFQGGCKARKTLYRKGKSNLQKLRNYILLKVHRKSENLLSAML